MRLFWTLVCAAALTVPALAQDETPPDEKPPDKPPTDNPPDKPPDDPPDKPPDETPPDETPPDVNPEEAARLKLVEKQAREIASNLKKRMDASKTDTERTSAINDTCGQGDVQHPLIAAALVPYLNPRQIKAGLRYEDGTIGAAIEALKKQPFDQTYYGVMKMIKDNLTDTVYVCKLIPIFGEIHNPKAIPDLVKFLRDKREPYVQRCVSAAAALGKLGHRDAVPQLIAEIEEEDNAGRSDEKMKARRAVLFQPTNDALKAITGQDIKLGAAWRAWWNKNESTFQKEKPPEVEPH